MTTVDVAPEIASEDTTPSPPRRPRTRAWVLALGGAVVALLLLAGASLVLDSDDKARPKSEAARSTRTTRAPAVNHPGKLKTMETTSLAVQLVEVPGYRYEDIPNAELSRVLAEMKQSPPDAASAHTVWDSAKNKEIAFLVLTSHDPTDPMHSQAAERTLVERACACGAMTRLDMSGQAVWLGGWPDRPASRYLFVWSRQGTIGWADGPDRAQLETWLRKYMATPVVAEGESAEVVARLRPLVGFSYTRLADEDQADAQYGFDSATRYLFDRNHMFGGITIAGPTAEWTDRPAFLQDVTDHFGPFASSQPDWRAFGGISVAKYVFGDGKTAFFVWWWEDARVGGWVTTSRPDIAEQFFAAYLPGS